MAENLQDILTRVVAKSEMLLKKYASMAADKQQAEARAEVLEAENAELRQRLHRLEVDNENLRIVRQVASSPEQLAQGKATISQLVRDIDKCIAQLTE